MLDDQADISVRLLDGHVDIPRMKAGGLNAAFFSIWVDDTYGPGTAYQRALALIAAVRGLADRAADVELATTAANVRAAAGRGHVAALMGVEGGHAIENSLEKLDTLYACGVRYMTLTWNNGNDWAGSSLDNERCGGLSEFGRAVVRRMNELGMLVDVSHASDATFFDVVAVTARPIIASHSSCRSLAAHPRNLTDEQLRAIAHNGGVVGINFFPVFLDADFALVYDDARRTGVDPESLNVPGLEKLIAHIDHAVEVMGVDHVGFGSDFDGISVLPRPMKDATSLPLFVAGLRARGYGDSDVRKILGENFLRVLSAAR
ncbi:MAG: dipeptidase [Gemmatimonadales bacterium]